MEDITVNQLAVEALVGMGLIAASIVMTWLIGDKDREGF